MLRILGNDLHLPASSQRDIVDGDCSYLHLLEFSSFVALGIFSHSEFAFPTLQLITLSFFFHRKGSFY